MRGRCHSCTYLPRHNSVIRDTKRSFENRKTTQVNIHKNKKQKVRKRRHSERDRKNEAHLNTDERQREKRRSQFILVERNRGTQKERNGQKCEWVKRRKSKREKNEADFTQKREKEESQSIHTYRQREREKVRHIERTKQVEM